MGKEPIRAFRLGAEDPLLSEHNDFSLWEYSFDDRDPQAASITPYVPESNNANAIESTPASEITIPCLSPSELVFELSAPSQCY